MTVTGGDSTSEGGGIRSRESLRLTNVHLVDNAAVSGGAIEILVSGSAQVILESSVISKNRSWEKAGGVFMQLSNGAACAISDSTFDGNRAGQRIGLGGGLLIEVSGVTDITISRNAFTENVADFGGGAYIESFAGPIVVDENVFSGNKTDDEGGGLYLHSGSFSVVTVTRNQFLRNSANGRGGGAYIREGGNVTVSDNKFVENSTDATGAEGGGLYARHHGALNILIFANEFRENTTDGTSANGGGIAIFKTGGGTAQFFNNVLTGNGIQGTSRQGLGIYASASAGSTIRIHSNNVQGNLSMLERAGFAGISVATSAGGSAFVEHNIVSNNFGGIAASGAGYMEVNDNFIVQNSATGLSLSAHSEGVARGRNNRISGNRTEPLMRGGGVVLIASSGAIASIEDCLVEGNSTDGQGAGVYARLNAGGTAEVRRTTIVDNHVVSSRVSANYGGGVYVDNRGGGIFILEQSTITGNSTVGDGGGIALGGLIENDLERRFVIRQSTIAMNIADSDNDGRGTGGGIHVASGDLYLDHTIVALNSDNSARAPDIAGSLREARFNLVGNNTGSPLSESPSNSPDASGNLIGGPVHGVIDPLLGALSDNGGFTPTLALQPGSPAIGKGDPMLEPGIDGAPEFDQRAAPFTRLAGSRVDIGAFELQTAGGALTADFNFDGLVDGGDFLAWQRSIGRSSATIRHGDATADGDVDANDLAVWQARFMEALPPTVLFAVTKPSVTKSLDTVLMPQVASVARDSVMFEPPVSAVNPAITSQSMALFSQRSSLAKRYTDSTLMATDVDVSLKRARPVPPAPSIDLSDNSVARAALDEAFTEAGIAAF